MSQGANANYSGAAFEGDMCGWLRKHGHKTSRYRYKALWYNKQLNETDGWLKEDRIMIECKNQDVNGTADQKFAAVLMDAHYSIDIDACKHYVLVYGGSWWEYGRGLNIYNNARRIAKDINEKFSVDDKEIHVMKFDEFKKWLPLHSKNHVESMT